MSVQSLTRAFEILKIVSTHPEGIGVTSIAAESGLHKSTVSRLLVTLETLNAVERLPKYDGYCIGPGIADLVTQSNPHQKLIHIARPYLREITDVTSEATVLEVPDGWFVHYLDQVQSSHEIRVNNWVGRRHPIHTVTSGLLFMSTWTEQALQHYFAQPLESPTPDTITNFDQMKGQCAKARQAGYAISVDAFEVGLTGISAPIIDDQNNIIAALNICAPTFRFPAKGQLDRITKRLTTATQAISAQIIEAELL